MLDDSYFRMMHNNKASFNSNNFLSREYELELVRLAQSDDPKASRAAKDKLTRAFFPMISSVARRKSFASDKVSASDLIQDITIGFLHAVDTFDPSTGNRLSTFAQWHIKSAMQKSLLNSLFIKIGSTTRARFLFFNIGRLAAKKITPHYTTHQFCLDMANEYNLPIETIVLLMENHFHPTSTEAIVSGDGVTTTVGDLIASDEDIEETVQTNIDTDIKNRLLREAVSQLNERDQLIVNELLLSDDPDTLRAVAKRLGVSTERTRQLRERAVKRLRVLLMPNKETLMN